MAKRKRSPGSDSPFRQEPVRPCGLSPDLGCYGHPKIKMPILDKVVNDGIRLTSCYSGVDVWKALIGETGGQSRGEQLFWHGIGSLDAIRVGDCELFVDRKGAAIQNKQDPVDVNAKVATLANCRDSLLFNLTDKAGDLTDLGTKYPERVEEMRDLAEKQMTEIRDRVIPFVKQGTVIAPDRR